MDDREELSRRLWLLRQELEQLLCALEIQQLVLANDKLRWLPMVSENVEHLVDDIRRSEAERVVVARRLGTELGLADDATLGELADAAGEPYTGMWRQHRLHLLALHAEIDAATHANHDISRRGLASSREILESLAGNETSTYDASASGRPATPRPTRSTTSLFDRSA